jgi:hypothetical protein
VATSLGAHGDRQQRRWKVALVDNDWTDEQAQGLLCGLNLDGGTPKWKREHLQKLRSWCSAHEKDSTTLDGQLEFVAYELCNTYEGVGMALKQANSVEAAKEAIEPFMKRLRVSEERFGANDASGQGPFEANGKHAKHAAALAACASNYVVQPRGEIEWASSALGNKK